MPAATDPFRYDVSHQAYARVAREVAILREGATVAQREIAALRRLSVAALRVMDSDTLDDAKTLLAAAIHACRSQGAM